MNPRDVGKWKKSSDSTGIRRKLYTQRGSGIIKYKKGEYLLENIITVNKLLNQLIIKL